MANDTNGGSSAENNGNSLSGNDWLEFGLGVLDRFPSIYDAFQDDDNDVPQNPGGDLTNPNQFSSAGYSWLGWVVLAGILIYLGYLAVKNA